MRPDPEQRFTRFAIFGALGGSVPTRSFGPILLTALASLPNMSVLALTRGPPSIGTDWKSITHGKWTQPPDNVTTRTYDLESGPGRETLVQLLKGERVEVVISTVGFGGIDAQREAADVAKAAGASLFVPSEWSLPTDGPLKTTDLLYPKKKIHEHLNTIGLPYALFFNGPFADNLYEGSNWTYVHEGRAEIVGKGETPISFCTRDDIARFAAHALTTFSLSQLTRTPFFISSFSATWGDIISAYDDHQPSHSSSAAPTIQRVYISYDECRRRVDQGDPHLTRGRIIWDEGAASLGTDADKADTAALWPGWKPKQLADLARAALQSQAAKSA